MVCLVGGRLEILPFDELRDPVTGRTKVRLVDINSEHYKVAREYMIRLEREDLENPEMLAKLAAAAKMTPEEFKKKFAHVVGLEA
jgi:6-phosphofructokinase 1